MSQITCKPGLLQIQVPLSKNCVVYNRYIRGINLYASKHEAYLLVQDQEELVDLRCTCFVTNVYYKERPSFSEPRSNFGSPPSAYVIQLNSPPWFPGRKKSNFYIATKKTLNFFIQLSGYLILLHSELAF